MGAWPASIDIHSTKPAVAPTLCPPNACGSRKVPEGPYLEWGGVRSGESEGVNGRDGNVSFLQILPAREGPDPTLCVGDQAPWVGLSPHTRPAGSP